VWEVFEVLERVREEKDMRARVSFCKTYRPSDNRLKIGDKVVHKKLKAIGTVIGIQGFRVQIKLTSDKVVGGSGSYEWEKLCE
jgi:hypothetical protein